MLEKSIQALEREKEKAISKVKLVCKDSETLDLAVKEIDVNYLTVRNFLRAMADKGFTVCADLSSNRDSYNRCSAEEYRRDYSHIVYHLTNLRNVPVDIEAGQFKPVFALLY